MNLSIAAVTLRCRRAIFATLPFLVALAGMTSAVPVRAVEQGPYSMEVLVKGRPLAELVGRGRTYIQAIPEREYSLRLTNNTAERVAIAVSVDGLNSIDAKTSGAYEGAKWILGPWESITLDGWQTSGSIARRFFFTSEENSYGTWLGKTSNLGVIAAVVFRERVQPIPEMMYQYDRKDVDSRGSANAEGGAAAERRAKNEAQSGAPTGSMEPAPPGAAQAKPQPQEMERQSDSAAKSMPAPADKLAATGIGRQVDHQVERVSFDCERRAAASLELRYEYAPALVKLGLLAPPMQRVDPLARREHARGFSDNGFAPDPYRQPN
ncbi:MAG: hypothetical protein ABI609_18925 [Acidobacteriota bacterium]